MGIFIVTTTPDGQTIARFHSLQNALAGRSAAIKPDEFPPIPKSLSRADSP